MQVVTGNLDICYLLLLSIQMTNKFEFLFQWNFYFIKSQ